MCTAPAFFLAKNVKFLLACDRGLIPALIFECLLKKAISFTTLMFF